MWYSIFNSSIENENKDCKEDAYLKMRGMKLTSTRSEDNVILVHRIYLDNLLKAGIRDGADCVEGFGVDVKSMGRKTNEAVNSFLVVVDPLFILFSNAFKR